MKLRVKPLFHNCRVPAVVEKRCFWVFSSHTGHSPSDSWFGVARCTWAIHLLPPVFCCYLGLHLIALPASPWMALGLLLPKAHLNTISRGPESKLGQGVSAQGFTNKQGSGCGGQRCWQLLKWPADSIQVHSLCPSDKPSSGFSSTTYCSPAWVRVEEGT